MNEAQASRMVKNLEKRLGSNNPNNITIKQYKTQIKFCLPNGQVWEPVVVIETKPLSFEEAHFYVGGILKVMDGQHVEKVTIMTDERDTASTVAAKIEAALDAPPQVKTVTREEAASMMPEMSAEELAAFLPEVPEAW